MALRGRALGDHFVNVLVWELLTGLLWVAGAIADEDRRIVFWTLAVVGAYGGTWTLHWLPRRGRAIDLGNSEIAGGYLIERFRLFFIILLGETVLTMGNAFADEPFEVDRLLALMISFTGTVALWWCYCQRTEAIGVDAAKTAEGTSAVGWWGTLTLMLIVLGMIGIAVGDEMAIAHPGDDPTLGFTILTFGGPACSCSRRSRSGHLGGTHVATRWKASYRSFGANADNDPVAEILVQDLRTHRHATRVRVGHRANHEGWAAASSFRHRGML